MSAERRQQVERLYQLALQRPSAERQAFLSAQCGSDSELRREVESLLARADADEAGKARASAGTPGGATPLRRLGKYELLKEIGRGGFGSVYTAWDPMVEREVAVKVLISSSDPDLLQRFRNEASSAGKLRHQNIVTIYDFGEDQGVPFIVMEMLNGKNLHEIMAAQGRLSLDRKVSILTQSAAGLHHAHINGLVHRDIKPGNIMVLRDFSVKLLDFGIARLMQASSARLTQQGMLIGTANYMSPEQLRGTDSDAISDIFSLGVVAYEFFAGKHPFQANDPIAVMFAITSKEVEPLRKLAPDCPPALEEVVMRALSKDRDERYQSAEDIVLDLQPVLRELRQQRAARLLEQAERDVGADQLDTATGVVREILELDPGNTAARQLRDTVQRKQQRRTLKPKIDALLSEGQDLFSARQFDAAMERLDAAMRLDRTDQTLQALRERVGAAQEQAKKADALVEEARRAFREKNLTGAYQSVSAAINTDREHPDAAALLQQIRGEIDSRERERALREGLTKCRSLLLVEAFEEAQASVTALEAQYPDSAELRELKTETQRRKAEHERGEKLLRGLTSARELFRQKKVAEAIRILEPLAAEFPNTAEVADLLSFAKQAEQAERQAQDVAETEREVEKLCGAHDFAKASSLVQGALKQYPGDATLSRLQERVVSAKAVEDREQAIRTGTARGEELRAKQKFAEAAQLLDQAIREQGSAPALTALRARVETEWAAAKREQARQAAIVEIQSLLPKGQAGEAISSIQRALTAHPGDAELQGLLGSAQKILADQQRDEAVRRAIQEIEALLTAGQLDRAQTAVDDALRKFPQDPGMKALGPRLAAAQKEAARKRAVEAVRGEITKLLKAGSFGEALQKVEEALKRDPDDELVRLKREVEAQWAAEKLRVTLTQAREHLDADRVVQAISTLEGAGGAGGPQEVAGLLAYARERQRAVETRAAIEKILIEGAGLADAGRLEEAHKLVAEACSRYANDAGLLRLRETIAERLRAATEIKRREAQRLQEEEEGQRQAAEQRRLEAERLRQLEEQARREEARKLEEAEQTRLAAEKAQLAAENAKQEAERKAKEEAERRAREEAERKRQAEEAARREEARKREEAERAQLAAEQARQEAERKAKEEAERKAREEAERQRREAEDKQAAEVLQRAAQLRGQKSREEARKLVDEAIARLGPRTDLTALRQQIAGDLNRAQSAQQTFDQAWAALRADQVDVATQLATHLETVLAGEVDTRELRASLAVKVEQQRVRAAVEAVGKQADALRGQGKFDEALALLDQAARQYSEAPALDSVRDRVRSEQKVFLKEQARKQAQAEISALPQTAQAAAHEGELQKTVARAEEIAAAYPENKPIQQAAKAVSKAAAARRAEWMKVQAKKEAAAAKPAATPAVSKPAAVALPAAASSTSSRSRLAIAAGAVALLLAGGLIWKFAGSGGQSLNVSTNPPGATVTVGAATCSTPNCALSLAPGTYKIQAQKAGYRTATMNVEIGKGAPAPVQLNLVPVVTRLLVSANFTRGSVSFDGKEAGQLRNGEFVLASVPAGTHTVDVQGPEGSATLKFEQGAGEGPKVLSAPSVKDTQAIVVTGSTAGAEVQCDCSSGDVTVDGKPAGRLQGGHLTLAHLSLGTHQFRVTAPDGIRDSVASLQEDPAVNLFLAADRNAGTLVVETGQDNVNVFLDNRLQTGVTHDGLMRIPVPVKQYSIRVEKPGFRKPAAQSVDVKKGALERVVFELAPLEAILAIRDAQPGVRLQIDGQSSGVTAGDGTLRANVPPGTHTIDLTKDGYTPRHLAGIVFDPGATINLGKNDVELAEIKAPALPTQPPPQLPPAEVKQLPDPRAIEAQEWDRLRNSRNLDQLEEFRRKYPSGANSEQAARRIEQLEWESLQNSRDTGALDAFVRKYPNGPNTDQARKKIEEIEWAGVNKQNADQIRAFLQRHPGSAQTGEANTALASLQQGDKLATDRRAILQVLAQYQSAYSSKNIQDVLKVWPSLAGTTQEKNLRDAFRNSRTIALQLTPNRDAEVSGDSATVQCRRTLQQTTDGQPLSHQDNVAVTLRRNAQTWTIQDIK
ncbi:MAG TPA: protein kinase [Bryobacteraceae bacterium]|jgi:serine/threonine-protein kinase